LKKILKNEIKIKNKNKIIKIQTGNQIKFEERKERKGDKEYFYNRKRKKGTKVQTNFSSLDCISSDPVSGPPSFKLARFFLI